jgi:hypothetical protein
MKWSVSYSESKCYEYKDDQDRPGTGRSRRIPTLRVDNYFPLSGARNYSTDLFKVLVVIMAVGLVFTTLLGLMMAFRFAKRKVLITLILFAGMLVPIFLLYLGEGARKNLKSPETIQSVPAP